MVAHTRKHEDSPRAATTSTLHVDGRITVPREIRAELGLMPGDKLAFTLHNNGDLVVRKVIA